MAAAAKNCYFLFFHGTYSYHLAISLGYCSKCGLDLNTMPKRVLVTGGTGFIGCALVRALVARGDRVRTFDNDWRGSRSSLSDLDSKVEILSGDIRDASYVERAVRGVEAVCHLAAVNGTENFYKHPDLVLEVGVKGMVNLLDAIAKTNVAELFVMSTSEVYQTAEVPTDEAAPLIVPDPLNPRYSYGSSKIISEMMALHLSKAKRTCVVRPHNVYGPRMGYEHVIPQLVEKMLSRLNEPTPIPFPIQGDGSETRSFCFIDDFIAGFLRIFDAGENRNIYHIGTEIEVSIRSLAQSIAHYFGQEILIQATPRIEGSTLRRCPNISKVRKLGFEPKINLEQGLALTIPWYQEHRQENRQENRKEAHEIPKA